MVHRCAHWSRPQSVHGEIGPSHHRETKWLREETHVCRDPIHRTYNLDYGAKIDIISLRNYVLILICASSPNHHHQSQRLFSQQTSHCRAHAIQRRVFSAVQCSAVTESASEKTTRHAMTRLCSFL